jgi:hypothetical protein
MRIGLIGLLSRAAWPWSQRKPRRRRSRRSDTKMDNSCSWRADAAPDGIAARSAAAVRISWVRGAAIGCGDRTADRIACAASPKQNMPAAVFVLRRHASFSRENARPLNQRCGARPHW